MIVSVDGSCIRSNHIGGVKVSVHAASVVDSGC
jgi:hypothetical protein